MFDFGFFLGIFAPLSKISKAADRNKSYGTRTATPVRPPRRVSAKFKTGKGNIGGEHY